MAKDRKLHSSLSRRDFITGMTVTLAAVILLSPARSNPTALIVSCIMVVIGIWIEKGLGFIVPGFIPSTLGDFVQYLPSAPNHCSRLGS